MKKILCLVLAAAMAMGVLTACGSGSGSESTQTTQTQTTVGTADTSDTTAAEADTAATEAAATDAAGRYTFVYKGISIDMKAEASSICEALGEAKSYTEETSCAFDGLDKNYVYPSFIMTTYPDGDQDRVNSVTLQDDTVGTTEGICIGDSKEKVEEVYGSDSFNGINAFIMKDTDAQLTIILGDDDHVYSIQYTAVFD